MPRPSLGYKRINVLLPPYLLDAATRLGQLQHKTLSDIVRESLHVFVIDAASKLQTEQVMLDNLSYADPSPVVRTEFDERESA